MICTLGDLPITSPEQTFRDLASWADLVELVVFGDSLIRSGATTLLGLREASKRWSGGGSARARRAVRYVRAGVDSAMETRLRMLLVLAGLPEPTVNHVLERGDGGWRYRFDLCYPDLKLIVEYDGRQHAENDAQWRKDLIRREWLDRNGWRIIVVTATGVYAHPLDTLERVRDALRERGGRIPSRFRPDWPRHFPGRS
ncbi:MAG: DUF559 domain-containing protein [Microlunatus sp.]|nr:DUF559 domain-containing protein [Microlunatus sp.]MDN5771015.1 DUF559 domain-containing protein [Microlunatus sp.]